MCTLQHSEDLLLYYSVRWKHAVFAECLNFLSVETSMQRHEDGKPVHVWTSSWQVYIRDSDSVFRLGIGAWKLSLSSYWLQKIHLKVLPAAVSVGCSESEVCRENFWVLSLLWLRVSTMQCDETKRRKIKMTQICFHKRPHSELKQTSLQTFLYLHVLILKTHLPAIQPGGEGSLWQWWCLHH